MTIIATLKAGHGYIEVPGSGRASCRTCGHAVIVSPSSMRIIETNLNEVFEFVCMECVPPQTDIRFNGTSAQIEEIRAAIPEAI